jgi:hypothetical protein
MYHIYSVSAISKSPRDIPPFPDIRNSPLVLRFPGRSPFYLKIAQVTLVAPEAT